MNKYKKVIKTKCNLTCKKILQQLPIPKLNYFIKLQLNENTSDTIF